MTFKKVIHLGLIKSGGAAIAAKRISRALQDLNVNSEFVGIGESNNSNYLDLILRAEMKIDFELGKLSKSGLTISPFKGRLVSNFDTKLKKIIQSEEIINLHWFPNFKLDLLSSKKLVVTLHDMNFFTGVCHHSFECNQYEIDCGECPQIIPQFETFVKKSLLIKKRDLVKLSNVTVVSPSNWLAKKASQSALLKSHEITVIRNPVPVDDYDPKSRNKVRAKEQISDYFVIGMLGDGAGAGKNHNLLLESYRAFKIRNPKIKMLLLVINSNNLLNSRDSEIHFPSLTESEVKINLAKMDLFLYHSKADNFPNLLIECQSSGVPVVANEIGGATETFVNGESGLAVDEKIESYLNAMQVVLDDTMRTKLFSNNARRIAIERYSPELIAKQYLGVYEQIIQS